MPIYPTKPVKILTDLQSHRNKVTSIRTHLANLLRKQGRLQKEILDLRKALKKHIEASKGLHEQLQSPLETDIFQDSESPEWGELLRKGELLFEGTCLEWKQCQNDIALLSDWIN
jgi:hypothetical protein